MENQNIIDLPTYEDLNGITVTVSDYARMSANFAMSKNHHDEPKENQAVDAIWLAQTDGTFAELATYPTKQGQGQAHQVDDVCVGVAPSIKQASQHDFGVQNINGQTYLTYQGNLQYYPQTSVEPALSARLEQERNTIGSEKLHLVTAFGRPVYYARRKRIDNYLDFCCVYENQSYVNLVDCQGRSHWFNCEPIKVKYDQQADKIQCLNALVAAPFDTVANFTANYFWIAKYTKLDISQSLLAPYLNQDLLINLQKGDLIKKYITKKTVLKEGFFAKLKNKFSTKGDRTNE